MDAGNNNKPLSNGAGVSTLVLKAILPAAFAILLSSGLPAPGQAAQSSAGQEVANALSATTAPATEQPAPPQPAGTITGTVTDGTGATQPAARTGIFPNGATGWDSAAVTVT